MTAPAAENKIMVGSYVRRTGTSAWSQIDEFYPLNDEYAITDPNGTTGTYVPQDEMESGAWEIWGPGSPPPADVARTVDQISTDIVNRLEVLKPLVEEFGFLERALEALNGPTATTQARIRGYVEVPRRRRGRPPGSGQRSQEVLALLKEKGGLAVAEIATALDIKPNYLYRVLPKMEREGQIAKVGRLYHLEGEAS